MANIISILEAVLGYPAAAIIKDLQDLRAFHKPYRNMWVLSMGGVGSLMGGLIPTLFAPRVGAWVRDIVQTVLPVASEPGYITGNLILVYVGVTAGLMAGKWSAQAYYYLRYKDSNSSHLLYPNELRHLVVLYQDLCQDKHKLAQQIGRIFWHLVHKIHQVKQPQGGNPIEPLSLEWSKDQLKGVLREFRAGNSDPYDFYVRLAHTRERFTHIRLQERIQALDQLMVEAVPPLPVIEPLRIHTPSSSAFTFRLPTPTGPRHRRRATISVQEVRQKAPKLGRYLSQWSDYKGAPLETVRRTEEVEGLREVLLARSQKIREQTQEIPLPLVPENLSVNSPPAGMRSLRLDI